MIGKLILSATVKGIIDEENHLNHVSSKIIMGADSVDVLTLQQSQWKEFTAKAFVSTSLSLHTSYNLATHHPAPQERQGNHHQTET